MVWFLIVFTRTERSRLTRWLGGGLCIEWLQVARIWGVAWFGIVFVEIPTVCFILPRVGNLGLLFLGKDTVLPREKISEHNFLKIIYRRFRKGT